jgi:hypothetical protein
MTDRYGRRSFLEEFWKRVPLGSPDECWEWAGTRTRTGYGQHGYGRNKRTMAHRVSYQAAHGPIRPGMCVCHKCDNPPCVNPNHLWLGTPADNARDRVAKGRSVKWNGRRSGENSPWAKLTAEDVLEIRRLRGKVSQSKLAERFSVSQPTICSAQNGRTWDLRAKASQ